MNRAPLLLVAVAAAALLSACDKPAPEAASPATKNADVAASAAPPSSSSPASTDRWLGKWTGPEGSSLEIQGANGDYTLVVTNLDGPRSFKGRASAGRIDFTRDGTAESVKAGSGADTGMKWLAEKSDCLVVKPGEGYCRG